MNTVKAQGLKHLKSVKKARELTGLTADGVKSLFRRMLEQELLVKMREKEELIIV